MKARLNALSYATDAYSHLVAIENYLVNSGLEHNLLLLVKLRASQMNGCAYCIDMHWKDARAGGESEQRLYGLDAWEESPYYSERERAALAWTEAVTRIGETHAPDDVFERVRAHFSEKETVDLTLAVAMINAWNRIAIPLRMPPGHYHSAKSS